jgi:hypothetical protein
MGEQFTVARAAEQRAQGKRLLERKLPVEDVATDETELPAMARAC